MKLYGAKCHICAHLLGHDADPIPWLASVPMCQRCAFCQRSALNKLLGDLHGDEVFSPEVRQAVADLMAGRTNPIIDQLRAEIQAESAVTGEAT